MQPKWTTTRETRLFWMSQLDLSRLALQELSPSPAGNEPPSSSTESAPSARGNPDGTNKQMPLEDTRDWISSFTFAAELDDSETPAEGSFTLHILDRDLIPAKEFKSALTQEPALRCLSTLLDGNGQVLPADPRQLDEKLSGKELDDGPIVFLEQIFVSEHRRRQGVGSWMVDRMWDLDCMQEAVIDNELEKARSAANLASSADQAQFVCTCLPTPLAPELRKFFEKNGFKQIRDTPIWGAARPESKRASLHTPPSL